MPTPSNSAEATRLSLLDQLASITTMQPGTLAEEWRQRPDPDGEGILRVGPYFKHQIWKDGRNASRRVPVEEAVQLREDIDNAKRFDQLTNDLARLNIEHTLALRALQAATPDPTEAKKNSAPKQTRKGSPKPKPSSPKPKPT